LHEQEEIAKYDKICDEAYLLAKKETAMSNTEWLDSPWTDFFSARRSEQMKIPSTSVPEDTLVEIGQKVSEVPEDFVVHGGMLSGVVFSVTSRYLGMYAVWPWNPLVQL